MSPVPPRPSCPGRGRFRPDSEARRVAASRPFRCVSAPISAPRSHRARLFSRYATAQSQVGAYWLGEVDVAATERISFTCTECGAVTSVGFGDGRVAEHERADGRAERCRTSGVLLNARHTCAHCGVATAVSLATRRVHRHRAPDKMICAMAGARVRLNPFTLQLLPPRERMQQGARPQGKKQKPAKRKSRSVWTVSGGLPTLGKRR